MQVSESWVVYSYWSAIAQRTEMSTLSLYEGMIDKYGLSPFNRVSLSLLKQNRLLMCFGATFRPLLR